MARSKQLHYVQHEVNIEQPDDPQGNWADGVIQVDALLSQKFGRTIRNGNAFRLVGYGASLRGFNSASDVDVGFAGVASLQYCPVTKKFSWCSSKTVQGMDEAKETLIHCWRIRTLRRF